MLPSSSFAFSRSSGDPEFVVGFRNGLDGVVYHPFRWCGFVWLLYVMDLEFLKM